MNLSTTDPAGRIIRYGYFPDGRLKTLTDSNGNLTAWERDIQGRVTAKVYVDASRETYAYEPSTARLKSRTDALAQRTDYGYAPDDRLTALDYVGALEPTPAVRFYPQGELRGSQRLYYLRDHMGSVREVKDLTSGQTVAGFDYTPCGARRAPASRTVQGCAAWTVYLA